MLTIYPRFALPCVFAAALSAQPALLMNRYDEAATGANLHETVLTPANVRPATFGKLYSYYVDGSVFAQPLYVPAVQVPGRGVHNLLFVATMNDRVYAFDADRRRPPAVAAQPHRRDGRHHAGPGYRHHQQRRSQRGRQRRHPRHARDRSRRRRPLPGGAHPRERKIFPAPLQDVDRDRRRPRPARRDRRRRQERR